MSKRSSLAVLSCLAVTALAGIAPASAKTVWIPMPLTSGGKTKVQLETAKEGSPRRLEVSFVETGRSGTGLTSRLVSADNERTYVLNPTYMITGPGMLRLVNEPGPDVRVATLGFSAGNDDLAVPLPIVNSDNWFETHETAYLQNMARNARGHANIEIMNFGSLTATCSIQLRRPLGSAFGPPTTLSFPPVSHNIVDDPFENLVTGGGGLRAEVECNQPFYAYGTFVGVNKNVPFRMLYPLSGPPEPATETLSVVRNGVFFTPRSGASDYDLELPLVEDRAYRKVTINFDVFVKQFTPIFTGLVGMLHTGGPRFNKTLYFGTFVRGNRAKTLVDLGTPVLEAALRVNSPWKQNTSHHVTLVFDAESATTQMKVTQGTKTVMDVTGGAYNLDIADRGAPVRVAFGLKGVADNAYFPPIGWRFSNLNIKIER